MIYKRFLNKKKCSYKHRRLEVFDRPISADEVLKAVKKKQKTNKAYGMDCLLNEYFIETIDMLLPFICDIFNAVLDSDVFPDSWMEGIVIPLHKKGDKNDVNNNRGLHY